VLWDGNQIGEGVALRSCVVGSRNQIGARTHITDGAVISDACIIEADNRLERGIRIWPETHLRERSISF
ncbi:MAG: NDP-sugar synthase, partial [Roseiflexaceae bacterium]|nr:NDP-sugar synthase [Roseiflexaceae bacterium]